METGKRDWEAIKDEENVIIEAIKKARKVAKSRNMPYTAKEIGDAIGVNEMTIYSFLKSKSPKSAIATQIFKL